MLFAVCSNSAYRKNLLMSKKIYALSIYLNSGAVVKILTPRPYVSDIMEDNVVSIEYIEHIIKNWPHFQDYVRLSYLDKAHVACVTVDSEITITH
jgi:hypothetical protein